MRPFTCLFGLFLFALMPSVALSAETTATPPLTDAQKAAVEEVVRNLLTQKEPDIIIKAAQEVQARQDTASAEKSQKAVAENKARLFSDAKAQIAGNPKGDVTIVEFFDYQCGYCKMAHETLKKYLAADKNAKVIYRQFPILGPASQFAAKASLASARQKKFTQFHDALLTTKERLDEDVVFKIASKVGLDVEKLKKDMEDPAIQKEIDDTIALGSDVGAQGTPSYVIGDKLYPGALPLEQMKKAVEDVRKAAKK